MIMHSLNTRGTRSQEGGQTAAQQSRRAGLLELVVLQVREAELLALGRVLVGPEQHVPMAVRKE